MTPQSGNLPCRLLVATLLGWVAFLPGAADEAAAETGRTPLKIRDLDRFELSGPYKFANLAVYLIHGEDRLDEKTRLLTLQEAMQTGKVKVKETGDVNRLAFENRSSESVYVQAGDIVRGGKQDRLVAHDLVLPPRSGKVNVQAFCVESGRWSRRGREAVAEFSATSNVAPGNALKLAVRESRAQSRVWAEVANVQSNLASNLDTEVRSSRSATSMELTLENAAVKRAAADYQQGLAEDVSRFEDVLGFVYAVNGELRGAHIYPSAELFRRLGTRLLTAAAVDAVAAQTGKKTKDAPAIDEVAGLLSAQPGGAGKKTAVAAGNAEHRFDYDGFLRFDARHAKLGWTHVEWIAKH